MIITNRYKIVIGLLISLVLWSCTFHYTANVAEETLENMKFKEVHLVSRTSKWVLHGGTRIFLSAPEVFNTYQHDYKMPTTQYKMYLSFLNAFSRAFPSITSSEYVWNVETALELAREAKAQVLIIPSLQLVMNTMDTLPLYEKERVDDPDQLYPLDATVVRISLYDVTSGMLIDVASLNSRGRFFQPRRYSLSRLIDRAAISFSEEISGLQLGPFG